MQLEKVHVTNFRSVDDSQEFTIDPVTCLVGKNEAGKSAILLALAALNPHPTTPAVFDKERDYPRRLLTQYEERHGNKEALAISTKWRLQARDMAKIEATIGKGVIKNDLVSIERRYGIEIEVNAQLNFAAGLANLYDRFALDESERAVLAQVTNTSELISTLAKLSSPTARHQELKAHMAANGTITSQVGSLIKSMLPKFMYFSSYDRMDGAIQLEQTRQLIANGQINTEMNRGARLFSEFLDYAGVSIDEITNVTTYETFNARLQAASNNITDQVLEYWTQNPDLSVAVRVEQARSGDPAPLNSGTIAWARINNHLHRVDTPFSERSAGFVWFFSFLVKFAQVKDEETPVVLLLDEPGLTLHGKAQADLLRFFKDKLTGPHRVVRGDC